MKLGKIDCQLRKCIQFLGGFVPNPHQKLYLPLLHTRTAAIPPGVYSRHPQGEYPPKVLYSPKNLRIRQTSATCAAKSFQLLGSFDHRPLNRGCAPGLRWGNSPQTPSSGVNPQVSTVSGYFQFLTVWCQNIMCKCAKSFSFWGTYFFPRPSELCPWTTLGDFRSSYPPAPIAVLSGNESLCFSLRLCFSNDVFMVGW